MRTQYLNAPATTLDAIKTERIIDGDFSAPPADWEPKGHGLEFATGLRIYAGAAGVVECAHLGRAHTIDLHADMPPGRITLCSDRLERFHPPSQSAALIPAGFEMRFEALNLQPATSIFINVSDADRLRDSDRTVHFSYWRTNQRIRALQSSLTQLLSNAVPDLLSIEAAGLAIASLMLESDAANAKRRLVGERRLRSTIRAIDFIESYLDSPLQIADLAAAAGMAPFHFIRCFQNDTGETPRQFIIRRRVEEARWRLQSSSESIAAIALRTGFSSQAHLTSSMRRVFGVTPTRIRTAFEFH